MAEYHLVILGQEAGFLQGCSRHLTGDFALTNKWVIDFLDPADRQMVSEGSQSGKRLMGPLGIRLPTQEPCLLYLHDRSGIIPEKLVMPPMVDGIIYLIKMPAVPSDTELSANLSRGPRINVPLALVLLSPEGVGPVIHGLAGIFASPEVAAQEAERDRDAVRLFLVQFGLGDLANVLELRFGKAGFFIATSEQGFLAPLIWVGHQAGVWTGEPGWERALKNGRDYWRRALQGREGRRAWNTTWGLRVLGGPAGLLLVGVIFGWRMLLGLAVGALGYVGWRIFRR